MNERKTIKLDKLLSNGTVHEEYKEFSTSIYSELYLKATRLVESIVNDNNEWIGRRKDLRNTDFERSNIISFVGKRGTGKTSAMLSFKDALDAHTKMHKFGFDTPLNFKNEKQMSNVRFYTLDCIDASIMEESENIFVLILANMFQKIQNQSRIESKQINEYENRKLFQKFEKIYEDYVSINSEAESMEGYSAFEKLRNAASSQKIRENFEELVKIYLETIDDETSDLVASEGKFLVITLDDIDIARRKKENGKENWGTYKIMSTIYKYLTVPRVIVLTAYDYENLKERCLRFFEEESAYSSKLENIDSISKSKYIESTFQFAQKVFPIYTRLYMPSWGIYDLSERDDFVISMKDSKSELLKEYRQNNQKDIFNKKEFIFLLLYDKTEVCLDYDRENKHFYEPDTLRHLFNKVEALNKLELFNHDIKSKDYLDIFQRNIKWVQEDCYYRYIVEILEENKYEEELLSDWIENSITKRGRIIVEHLRQFTIPLGLNIKVQYEKAKKDAIKAGKDIIKLRKEPIFDNSNVRYSYAELIHSIFHMTRDNNYSKNFVCCILYSFTLQLTEVYKYFVWNKQHISKESFFCCYRDSYKENPKCKLTLSNVELEIKENIDKYYKILKNMIGNTICGRWAEYFFPQVHPIALSQSHNNNSTTSYLERKSLVVVGYMQDLQNEFTIDMVQTDDDHIFSLKIKTFIFLSMMSLDVLEWKENDVSWDWNTDHFALKLSRSDGCDCEFTAFFIYTFCYTEYLNKIEQLLRCSLKSVKTIPEYTEQSHNERTKIDEKLNKLFTELWEDYYQWDKDYRNPMIPFYNLDITYNMIKKMFLECRSLYSDVIDIKMNDENTIFLKQYKKMMDKFHNYLKENIDSLYQTKASFSDAFSRCPFYGMVNELDKDRDSRITVSNYICQNAFNILGNLQISQNPEG